ncbi:ATP-binding protein [Methylobacter sp. S3L5C]|uniref:ATP-binding protein n=1 Tax=Methylobacter sp. S3L5C TaxID=2839024 RepID=UPI001FAC2807|nr:ATP-binding protein [Methylobacter sp. S3L5C]UOA09140.1 ATP-binding protein [Methylobacter sp. S3L5C]
MIITKNRTTGITLTIASVAKCVSPLCDALHGLCLDASGSDSCAHAVQLAVVEALNNVILHAYNNQPDNDIVVQWRPENRQLRIEIIDYGLSITSLPEATLTAWDAESGRGWWIINACVDEYYYKVIECIERKRVYKPKSNNDYSEDVMIKSHCNILTLIKKF